MNFFPSRWRGLRTTSIALLAMHGALACVKRPASSSPAPAVPAARRTDPTNGEDVIRAMHDRYAATWYKTLTFSQTTTIARPNGTTLVQQWLEAGKFPGRLRIDTDTAARGGVIYGGDSVYAFANGKLVNTPFPRGAHATGTTGWRALRRREVARCMDARCLVEHDSLTGDRRARRRTPQPSRQGRFVRSYHSGHRHRRLVAGVERSHGVGARRVGGLRHNRR